MGSPEYMVSVLHLLSSVLKHPSPEATQVGSSPCKATLLNFLRPDIIQKKSCLHASLIIPYACHLCSSTHPQRQLRWERSQPCRDALSNVKGQRIEKGEGRLSCPVLLCSGYRHCVSTKQLASICLQSKACKFKTTLSTPSN